MMYEQRVPPNAESFRPVSAWFSSHLAEVMPPARGLDTTTEPQGVPDFYVVVDEMDEFSCRLTVDRWPDTDEDGRLVFDDEWMLLRTVEVTVLHGFVTDARRRTQELVPDRPLRIGDVFAMWWGTFADEVLDLPRPDTYDRAAAPDRRTPDIELLDVTADARQITNAAAEAAASPVLTSDDMDRLDLHGPVPKADS